MTEKSVLLVESPNDKHVFYAILKHFNVPEVCKIESKDGVSNIIKTLKIQLKFDDEDKQLDHIGIVVDADTNIQKRWNEILKILIEAGYEDLPQEPHSKGTTIRQDGMPLIGIWIMPNNIVPGELEDFIEFLIPANDVLWDYATQCIDNLPEYRFSQTERQKARVSTWLAWQKEPGKPMGWAISRKYLNADVIEVHQFLDWFQQVFIS